MTPRASQRATWLDEHWDESEVFEDSEELLMASTNEAGVNKCRTGFYASIGAEATKGGAIHACEDHGRVVGVEAELQRSYHEISAKPVGGRQGLHDHLTRDAWRRSRRTRYRSPTGAVGRKV